MTKQKKASLLSWTFWEPLKFALYLLLLIFGIGIIFVLLANSGFNDASSTYNLFITLLSIGFVISAFFMIKKLPNENLDRKSFVALNNLQTFLISFIIITSSIIIAINADRIILKLLWLEANRKFTFLLITTLAYTFYSYLLGLLISNLYTKYRRCRAFGIKPWKIISSFPFGFTLLWIPGYFITDTEKKDPVLKIKTKWYNQLTDWILNKKFNTVIAFIILIFLSSFIFSLKLTILLFVATAIFAIWLKIKGSKKFLKDIPNKYSYFAITINVIILATIILLTTYLTTAQISDIHLNISDVPEIIVAE